VAVPKKRQTRAAQGQRRSHDAIVPAQLVRSADGGLVPRRLKKAADLGLIKTVNKA